MLLLTSIIVITFTSLFITVVQATTTLFNNAIQDEPEIECGQGAITLRVQTASQKPSYIFAKGYFHKDGCYFKQTNNVTFHFEQCNVNRKREVNPRGMAYSLTVIVQLHPLFITKVDRAYNVRCFYMEENKEVDAALQVSDLTTSILEFGHEMPQCSYTLHRDSPNGPVLRYARVGDVVFHVWDCPSDVYAMLIHTCYILDGQGGEHKVIDENGCSTDDFIIPQLTYSNELTRSFTGANVVNLPDRESIYFTCQVKLCFKKGDYCTLVTPPRCDDNIHLYGSKTQSEVKSVQIEDELQNDQLLYTTFPPITSSKAVRIVSDAPSFSKVITSSSSNTSQPQLQTATYKQPQTLLPYQSSIHSTATSMKQEDDNTTKLATVITNLPNTVNVYPTPSIFMDFSDKQNITDFVHDVEGSGEEDFSNQKAVNMIATTEEITTDITTNTGNSAYIITSTITTIISTLNETSTTATIPELTSTSKPNPTRGRRTVPKNDYKIVDLDVTTEQLKILEEDFDLPDLPIKSSLLKDQREKEVCMSATSLWILSAISLISVSIAIATVMYSRLNSRKMELFYRY